MSIEENKALANRIVEEIFNQGDLSRMDELIAPDGVVHDPDREYRGTEQIKQGITRLRAAFPDLRYTVEDMISGSGALQRSGHSPRRVPRYPADREADDLHGDPDLAIWGWQDGRTLGRGRCPGPLSTTGRVPPLGQSG